MSSAESPNGRQETSAAEGGILAGLPRARPQRSSPRRAAARSRASKAETVAPGAKPTATQGNSAKTLVARARGGQAKKRSTPTPTPLRAKLAPKATPSPAAKLTPKAKLATNAKLTTKKAKLAHPKTAEPPTPKQGYEPEEEVELGSTINPPSGVELVESVADIVGELANSGLAAGGRLLKDAFSLLRP